jgi:hypothetical protein
MEPQVILAVEVDGRLHKTRPVSAWYKDGPPDIKYYATPMTPGQEAEFRRRFAAYIRPWPVRG